MTQDDGKRCSGCGGAMRLFGREQIQLGRSSLLFGTLPHLLAGALDVEIWECPDCGKLDLYRGEEVEEDEGRMAQVICPRCGAEHDLDDPKCPNCGARDPNI